MFTGLVELIGTVEDYTESSEGATLKIIDAAPILSDCHLGDSIAVNGTCLTVTSFDSKQGWFYVGISNETIRRTNLGSLKNSTKVNLERAVTADVRLGGHIVQGHIDTVASIVSKRQDGDSIIFEFELREKQYSRYIVEKGFIAIDGTSLTVTEVDHEKSRFKIMMVNYTQGKVIMPLKSIQDEVNIEVDLTGKLIERQVELSLNNSLDNKDSKLVKLIESLVEKKLTELKN